MELKKKKKEKEVEVEVEEPKKGFDLIFGNGQPSETSDLTPREQTLQKALEELFSTEGIDLKSDIDSSQVSALTRGYIFGDVYKCKYMHELVRHVLELSVSKNRQGRTEFVRVLQSSTPPEEDSKLRLMRRRLLE